jgi:hypothetical protein
MKGILDEKNRDKLERYWTPLHVAEAHVRHASMLRRRETECPNYRAIFVDPFAGGDVYYNAAVRATLFMGSVVGDIDHAHRPHRRHWRDTLAAAADSAEGEDLFLVTNPAFTQAPDVIRTIWFERKWHDAIVSFLLPASFLEAVESKSKPAQGRKDILTYMCPIDVTYVGRIEFEGPAIDARKALGLRVAKAAMQYAFVTWKIGTCGEQKWLDLATSP